jgi:uncharacterized membrane protein YoaK (UPF0700 family)
MTTSTSATPLDSELLSSPPSRLPRVLAYLSYAAALVSVLDGIAWAALIGFDLEHAASSLAFALAFAAGGRSLQHFPKRRWWSLPSLVLVVAATVLLLVAALDALADGSIIYGLFMVTVTVAHATGVALTAVRWVAGARAE